MRKYLSSAFFVRLMLISSIMGVLPLVLLGYLSYHKSSTILQEEVRGGNRLILEQNRAKVEYLLKTVDTLASQMLNSPVTTSNVSMLSAMRLPYEYANIRTFESLKKKLVQIQVFELGVRDVNVMSYDQQWLIDNSTVFQIKDLSIDMPQDKVLLDLSAKMAEYESRGKLTFWTLEPAADDDSGYVLKLVKPIPIHSVKPVGMLIVEVPLQEISKRLTRDQRLGDVWIVDPSGTVISHPEPELIGANVADRPFLQVIHERQASSDDASYVYPIDGHDHAVIYEESPYNQWLYISMTSIDSITAKSRDIKWYTFAVAACIIGLVFMTALFVSRRLYTPVHSIYRFLTAAGISGEHKKDELKYIGERVRGMVQSQHHMEHQIEGLSRQAKEYFVMKLFQGELKPSELEERLSHEPEPFDWEQWCGLAVQIDTLELTRYEERELDLLLFAVHNIVEELIPHRQRLGPIVLNQSVAALFGKPVQDGKPYQVDLYALAEDIQRKVKHYLNLKISIGISRMYYDSLIQAPTAYRESMDALTYRIRLGHESILFMDEVQPEAGVRFKYPKELESGLFEAVKQQDPGLASNYLQLLIRELLERHISHHDSQILLGRLYNNLCGIVHDEGGSVKEVFVAESTALAEVMKLHSVDEVSQWFEERLLQPLMNWLELRRRSREVNISDEIMDMIREDYDKDLTIEQCAARLSFHPNYISRVFKKEMGTTFSNVLAQYRVDVAKRWLRETDMKIAEIAERLRYNHTSNFIRSFKKLEGATPNQYRDQAHLR